MATTETLSYYTDEFFKHYWSPSLGLLPNWSTRWDFNGEIPNQNRRGCYALLVNDEVAYIGLGIGNGSGIYLGAGLGYRLKRYYEMNKDANHLRKYKPKGIWLGRGITSLVTIGFPEHYYIAAGLEIYLIEQLQPKFNKIHR